MVLDPAARALVPQGGPQIQLERPRILLEKPQSQLGSPLGGPRSLLGSPGGTETKKNEKKNG